MQHTTGGHVASAFNQFDNTSAITLIFFRLRQTDMKLNIGCNEIIKWLPTTIVRAFQNTMSKSLYLKRWSET
jgi:hypothetical protein